MFGGVGLGLANSLSNALGSPYGPLALAPLRGVRWMEYSAAWLGTVWAYSLFAFGVGWLIRRPWVSAITAAAGLCLAVVAYYACDALTGIDEGISVGELQYWSVVSLLVGPTMALLGGLARTAGRFALAASLTMPGVMVASTAMWGTGSDVLQPWVTRTVYLAAAGLAVYLIVHYRQHRVR